MNAGKSITAGFCRWVIAKEYYDGPMSGIGLRTSDEAAIFFKAVAWDDEQWIRVFAIAPIRSQSVHALRAALEKVEAPKDPFWLPGPTTDTQEVFSAWQAVFGEAVESGMWTLVESHDLLDAVSDVSLSDEQRAAISSLVKQGLVKDIKDSEILSAVIRQIDGSGGTI